MRFIILIFVGALAACGTPTSINPVALSSGQIASYQKLVAETLRDPQSARFQNTRSFRTATGDIALCGDLNGTNGFGGYTGFTPYYARFRGREMQAIAVDGLARSACLQADAGTINITN